MQNRFQEFLISALWDAHREARKSKLKTKNEHEFELNAAKNIHALCEELIHRTYTPRGGILFIVKDPKYREVVAADYRDRVVHHFICKITNVWVERHLINDSYSCRKGKGTLYGIKRLQKHMHQIKTATKEEPFVAKFDIVRYFVSLDQRLLFRRAIWALDQQFHHCSRADRDNGILCDYHDREQLFRLLKFLWHEIIFDEPIKKAKVRGNPSDWAKLAPGKSLCDQPKYTGIAIGNLTSQQLSNLFLDQLDHFITLTLNYKHYGRYVDDFYIVVPASQRKNLINDVPKIEEFLEDELRLKLHKSKRLFQYGKYGIPFTGGVVYPDHVELSSRAKQRAYQAAEDIISGKAPAANFAARMGTTSHFNQHRFYKKLFDSYGWDYGWDEEKQESTKKHRNR